MKSMKKVLSLFLVLAMIVALLPSYMAVAQEGHNTDIPAGYTPIYTIADLVGINSNPSGKYILMNDIDMTKETSPGGTWDTGHGWTPLDAFSGVFDGNGHRIVGMHIYGKYQGSIGLFSKVSGARAEENAVIENLGIVNCDININGDSHERICIGGITGFESNATISQCFVSGEIQYSGRNSVHIGGIVGMADSARSIVQDCYNMATISAAEKRGRGTALCIGGIVGYGYSYGTDISNCYNMGNIDYPFEDGDVGAIVGYHLDYYYDSYIDDYYLNTSVSNGGQARDDDYGCKALTDAQMKYASSFASFDFKNTWMIDELSSYPYPQLRACPQVRVENLQLVSLPDKVTYSQGDKLDLSSAVLSVNYEDGVVANTEVDSSMVSGVNMNKIGEQTVTVSYLNKTCSFDISVEEAEVTDISLSKTNCSINRNAKLQLKAVVKPSKAIDKSVTWESDNEAVATVTKNGVVRGINAGSAVITATTSNGLTAECIVTVKVPVTGIRLNTTSFVLKKGKKKTIKVQGNFIKSTMFKSSKAEIATVSKKGVVTAKKAGSCKIMVTVKYRKTKNAKKLLGKKLTCKVIVKKVQSASTTKPTAVSTEKPATEPTAVPTEKPVTEPTVVPTEKPVTEPTVVPTEKPVAEPTVVPTEKPVTEPTVVPTEKPTIEPTATPTAKPVDGSKDGKDVAVITAIIAEQKSLGATVSEDLDSDEYSWSANGRLTGILWGNKNLQGSLSLQGLPQLSSLSCNDNQLTSLDVSNNTALTVLYCNSNKLSNLDVDNCKSLTYLICQSNQLTNLNIGNCTSLTELYCDINKLRNLDVSNCMALTTLSCFSNEIANLDVSNHTALTALHGGMNQLTSLNVSNCTALTHIGCNNNQLTSLDVNDCTALTSLDCFGNQIVNLDVSNHTALTSLNCSENKLTNLNVSACIALEELYCNNTQLTSLDVSSNVSLNTLWCSNSQLTSLDVSNCTALTSFQCDTNVTVTGRNRG